jgi:hypothetical protein
MGRIRPCITGSYAGLAWGFDKIFCTLAEEGGPPDRLMIDATYLKAHRTACSLLKGGMFPALLAVQRAG